MEDKLYRSKRIYKSVFNLIQSRSLNGVVDLYGLSLTKSQLDMLKSLVNTKEEPYRFLVMKIDTRKLFIVEKETESNLRLS